MLSTISKPFTFYGGESGSINFNGSNNSIWLTAQGYGNEIYGFKNVSGYVYSNNSILYDTNLGSWGAYFTLTYGGISLGVYDVGPATITDSFYINYAGMSTNL